MANFHKLNYNFKADTRANIRRLVISLAGGSSGFGRTFYWNNPSTLAYEKYIVPASTNLVPLHIEVTHNASQILDCEIGFHTDATHTGANPASGITNWIGNIATNLVTTVDKDGFQMLTTRRYGSEGVLNRFVNLVDYPIAPSSICSGKYVWMAFWTGAVGDNMEIAFHVLEEAV